MPSNITSNESNNLPKSSSGIVMLDDNYLYISHLDEQYQFWFLPQSPDAIQDAMNSNFVATNALGRSAPVWTYSNSGGRTVQVTLNLNRDIMDDVNEGRSNAVRLTGEDYVDTLIRAIQSIALPRYNLSNKAVEPPLVAVRFCDQIFIKGIVNGSVGVTYNKPIILTHDGKQSKYASVTLSFAVSEVDPYDATTVFTNGSFRGVVQTLKKGMNLEDR